MAFLFGLIRYSFIVPHRSREQISHRLGSLRLLFTKQVHLFGSTTRRIVLERTEESVAGNVAF